MSIIGSDDEYGFDEDLDENIYGQEGNVYERIGYGFEDEFGDSSVQTPHINFMKNVSGFIQNLIEEGVNMSTKIDDIYNRTKDLPNIQYKNPYAYVLAYFATGGGRNELTQESFKNAVKLIHVAKGSNITEPDIIRYSRYILSKE